MANKEDFIQAGFTVFGTENNENKLLSFLKEHYPNVIKDNEINLQELKAIAGLPIDEKVNGYGLNFVGRNFARAKYAQKTEKELRLNTKMSKNIDTTQNLVLKGDNLDSLKILKSHYSGKIKCIYIDPPYNTDSDEFVYPDKFDKEELEVLGLANLSENDFARMDFSFKTKQSHNGWLAFMYPRLLLARDLLSKDGVIFISIDDNEQANLKLLCDDVFGEENFLYQLSVIDKLNGNDNSSGMMETQEYCLIYAKNKSEFEVGVLPIEENLEDWKIDELGYWKEGGGIKATGVAAKREDRPNLYFPIYINENTLEFSLEKNEDFTYELLPKIDGEDGRWTWQKDKFIKDKNEVIIKKVKDGYSIYKKQRPALGDLPSKRGKTTFYHSSYSTANSSAEIKTLFNGQKVFDFSKSTYLIRDLICLANTHRKSIILDFFAGSGTTGHAVMQLNAEDGGNRKFILCQIDEPIKEDKPAY
ncbi:MAG TPA: site-specific DNA-methyltransferase, partial [Spirochaetota bacterium]|nr:site-specific DNA-methyltransferase [Spirochaetota bacterium]